MEVHDKWVFRKMLREEKIKLASEKINGKEIWKKYKQVTMELNEKENIWEKVYVCRVFKSKC